MADVFSKKKRSEVMSLIRSKNTKFEIEFLKLLSARLYPQGVRYRKHYKKIIGKPDVVFVGKKIAIFLDGDFWHGYNFPKTGKRLPKKFWQPKIKANIARDKYVTKFLKKDGWTVVRFWENQIEKDPYKAIDTIEKILRSH